LNLLFNLAFSPIQFGLKNNFLAAIDIVLVLATLLWALRSVWGPGAVGGSGEYSLPVVGVFCYCVTAIYHLAEPVVGIVDPVANARR
jgi:hypothetical protein